MQKEGGPIPQAIGIGLATGAVVGGLLGSHIPDIVKGFGTLAAALTAASLMGVAVLDQWQSTHPAAEYVNAVVAVFSILVGSRYGGAFWISGAIGLFVSFSVADSIRKSTTS